MATFNRLNKTSTEVYKGSAPYKTASQNIKTATMSDVQAMDLNPWGPVASVVIPDPQQPWPVDEDWQNYAWYENGMNGQQAGPLSELYRNQYKRSAIGYPRDLGLSDKGHVIQFDIRDVVPSTLDIAKFTDTEKSLETLGVAADYAVEMGNQAVDYMKQLAANPLQTVSQGIQVTGKAIESGLNGMSKVNINAQTTSDAVETIRLYMPDTLSFGYSAQYDKLSLAEAINSVPLVGKVSTAITSILENKATKALANRLGYTFNPQQQMLFEGIDFREFDLQFTFSPTSPEESQIIKDIIKKLRKAAAPTRQTAAGGFFFTPPSVFELSFFIDGQRNHNIVPLRPCVLQSVTIDYAPNGWAAMRDGAPVQTSISLSFKEIELIDRKSIEQEL